MTSLCKLDECVDGCIDSMTLMEVHLMIKPKFDNSNMSDWYYDKTKSIYYLPCPACHNIFLDRNRLSRVE